MLFMTCKDLLEYVSEFELIGWLSFKECRFGSVQRMSKYNRKFAFLVLNNKSDFEEFITFVIQNLPIFFFFYFPEIEFCFVAQSGLGLYIPLLPSPKHGIPDTFTKLHAYA